MCVKNSALRKEFAHCFELCPSSDAWTIFWKSQPKRNSQKKSPKRNIYIWLLWIVENVNLPTVLSSFFSPRHASDPEAGEKLEIVGKLFF